MKRSRRGLLKRVTALMLASGIPGRAARAQQPIRVGFSIAQTGPISGGGQAALVALRMWADDVNAKGGLLGRKVELVVGNKELLASRLSRLRRPGQPLNDPWHLCKADRR